MSCVKGDSGSALAVKTCNTPYDHLRWRYSDDQSNDLVYQNNQERLRIAVSPDYIINNRRSV
jgi:hypothetical protein